jgi:hypothetical protein
MSLHDYQAARNLQGMVPFDALIMAAIRQADTRNLKLLQAAFPQLADEADARYNAPGGLLPGDPKYREITEERQAIGQRQAAAYRHAALAEGNGDGQ